MKKNFLLVSLLAALLVFITIPFFPVGAESPENTPENHTLGEATPANTPEATPETTLDVTAEATLEAAPENTPEATLETTPEATEVSDGEVMLAPLLDTKGRDVVPDEYIVVMKPAFSMASNRVSVRAEVAMAGGEVGFIYDGVLNGFSANLPPQALDALQRNPHVAYIEPNGIITLDGEVGQEVDTSGIQTNPTWGLNRVDQRDLPLDSAFKYDNTAASVHVYVIDSGIRATHTEFTGRVLAGYNAILNNTDTNDCIGHGTHVTGTIAGTTYGVAKAAWIHPVRVFGCSDSTTTSILINGMNWVANNKQSPAVANMSLGGSASVSIDLAVNNLIAAGVTVVVAAGNDGVDACKFSPAGVPAAITVGATDSSDQKPSFSSFGSCLDLFAPGVSITSAYISSDTATATWGGTSMAAPHAAGAAALYLQTTPSATPAKVSDFLTQNATVGKVSNPGTGSPNLLLYMRLLKPVTLRPSVVIFNDKPAYVWTNVADATQYEVKLWTVDPENEIGSEVITTPNCNDNTCSAVLDNSLVLDVGYQWQVRAYANGGWGDWSEMMSFSLVVAIPTFLPLFSNP